MTSANRLAYEKCACEWLKSRTAERTEAAARLAENNPIVLDLGCGPGFHLPHLGDAAIGVDHAGAMLNIARSEFGHRHLVQADLERLPFADASATAAWASKSYVHIDAARLPIALHDAHRVIEVGGRFILRMFCADREDGAIDNDHFAGRRFTFWKRELLEALIEGAGFEIIDRVCIADNPLEDVEYDLVRARTLGDTVGSDMRVLLVGLNPSLHAADAGVGFISPSNRFWKSVVESGLINKPRDPRGALELDRVGMTDLVKRATTKAAELSRSEFQAGLGRLELMVEFLRPELVCVVGLTGWLAATGERAVTGIQKRQIGGRPVLVMPNPSGLNAHTSHDDLVRHFRAIVDRKYLEPRE